MITLEARDFLAFLGKAERDIPGQARRALDRTAKAVLSMARAAAPGGIKKGLHVEPIEDGFALVSEHKASKFVENGTLPHVIEASGKALRFKIGRRVVFAKRVHHPGTAPHPFFWPAMNQAETAFVAFAEQTVFRF